MKKPYFALLRHKCNNLNGILRKKYYRFLGMQISGEAVLGRIKCNWPNRVTVGPKCSIEDNVVFKITRPFAEDNFINIGERVFIGQGCEFNITLGLTIGNDCLIASNTSFVDAGRAMTHGENINKQPVLVDKITIDDDVWIGTRCVILKGVTIGKGSVIGAGSIVNKSIPAYQVWAGCPVRFVRNRD